MEIKKVRVRFAPSPTGEFHVGGARTAIYNWLFAKHMGGDFIIRVEDTDLERSQRVYEEKMLKDLAWIGLDWLEGPDVGGPHAPYRQSERLDIYKKYADQLVSQNKAYFCFCSDDLLTKKREEATAKNLIPQYDGTCKRLTKDEIDQKLASGEKGVIRFKSFEENIILYDLIRGKIEFKEGMVGDFIILRSDGLPTYNFAAVCDDHLMEISHVLRSEEHLSNTNRQIMIYRALDFTPPAFGHFSLVMGKDADGTVSKLSKRHDAVSLVKYKEDGYLSSALFNYLTLLGWSSPSGNEIMVQDKIISDFSLKRISKSSSIFDLDKLRWMNLKYLKNIPKENRFFIAKDFIDFERLRDYKSEEIEEMVYLVWDSLYALSELNNHLALFISNKFIFSDDDILLLKSDNAKRILELFYEKTCKVSTLDREVFNQIVKEIKDETGIAGKEIWFPIRLGITGQKHGPDIIGVVCILGKERVINLLKETMKTIGGLNV